MADIEKVIKAVDNCIHYGCKKCTYYDNGCEKNAMLADALELLKSQPQIVRCKDCKYVECEGVEGFLVCDMSGFSHSPEFFCADGERGESNG